MAGDQLRHSPVKVSRPATMLVVDCDSGLHQLLRKVIQEFELSLTTVSGLYPKPQIWCFGVPS